MVKHYNFMTTNCYCGTNASFELCCKPFIEGIKNAPTAEHLMRSRYSAFATQAADYLVATTHNSERENYDREAVLQWATTNKWLKLEVIEATTTKVAFKAYYLDHNKKPQVHQELSTFMEEDGIWYYVDGTFF
jgi:SEC-C motif-containing protein